MRSDNRLTPHPGEQRLPVSQWTASVALAVLLIFLGGAGCWPRFVEYCGVNLPWRNYGWDVGRNPWGGPHGGFSSRRADLEADFAFLAAHGIRAVRVFVFCDLRSALLFDGNGWPAGFDDFVFPDLDALFDTAEMFDLNLIPVIFDYTIADGVSQEGGVPVGEHPDVIADPAMRGALVDLLRSVFVRYKNRSSLLLWDLVNEPENAGVVSLQDRVVFAADLARMIEEEAPHRLVTVGSLNRGTVPQWQNVPQDIVGFHYYDYMEQQYPFDYPASLVSPDRPVLIGEVEATDVSWKLATAKRNGYLGVLFWSLNAGGDFRAVADEYATWIGSH